MATFPERALARLNEALVTISDALLAPFADVPPIVSLLFLSLLTAAIVVPIVGMTSDQARIRKTKRQLTAALFEIRLFNDDPIAVLRSVRDALRLNLTYLRLWLAPMVILTIPLTFAVAHLDPFYGYTGLRVGSTALLKVEPRAGRVTEPSVTFELQVPDSVEVETDAVRIAVDGEVLWRISPRTAGNYLATISVDGERVAKTISVSDGMRRRSPARVLPGILGQLFSPSEPPLDPDGPIASVTVTYPDASISILGTNVHWTLVYVAMTMGWAVVIARARGISL